MTLSPTFTPPERMAEIRKLLRDVEEVRADGARLDAAADALVIDAVDGPEIGPVDGLEELLSSANEAWSKFHALVALLLEHLDRAEADGSLAECEQMLRVTYGGAA